MPPRRRSQPSPPVASPVSAAPQAAPPPEASAPQVLAQQAPAQQEPLEMVRDITGTNAQGQEQTYFKIFSTEKPRSKGDFQSAFKTYYDTGETPPGFTVLPAGSGQERFRSGFQALIGDPLRKVAEAAESSPDVPTFRNPQNFVQSGANLLAGAGTYLGKSVLPGMLRGSSTPEGAAGSLGAAAGTALTGGAAGVIPALGAAGVTGLLGTVGYEVGNLLADSKKDIGEAFAYGGLAAAAKGFSGVLQSIGSRMFSKDVATKTAKDVLEIARKEYPHLANDPDILSYASTNKEALKKITQRAVTGMREDMQALTQTTRDEIMNAASAMTPGATPGAAPSMVFSKGEKITLRAQIRALENASADMLEFVNDPKKFHTAQNALDDSRQAIMDLFNQRFSGQPQVLTDVANTLTRHWRTIAADMGPAKLTRALESSGQEAGWNPKAFMREVATYFERDPGSALQQAGEIAAKATQAGAPGTPINLGVPLKVPFINKRLPFQVQVGTRYPMGESLTQSLPQIPVQEMTRGAGPTAPGAYQTGQDAMRSFTGGRRQQ